MQVSKINDVLLFANSVARDHQNFSSWLWPSKSIPPTIHHHHYHNSEPSFYKTLWLSQIFQSSRPTVIVIKNDDEPQKKEKKKEDGNAFILAAAAIVSGIGILILSFNIGKNAARVKSADEILEDIESLKVEKDKFSNNPEQIDFQTTLNKAKSLAERVKKNTTKVKIVPQLVILAGLILAFVGSLYKSMEVVKGGGVVALFGTAFALGRRAYYSEINNQIYGEARSVSEEFQKLAFYLSDQHPSAPTFD